MRKKMVYVSPTVKIIPVVWEEGIQNTEAMNEENKKNENPEENTGFLMLQVSNLWKGYHGKTLKKHHALSSMQYAVLTGVYQFSVHNTQPVIQTMLAKHLKIDAMTSSRIFKGLEAKGYICHVTHPDDVKAKAVLLTQEGKELLIQAVNIITESDHKFFKSLNENTEYFNKQLKKLLEANQ